MEKYVLDTNLFFNMEAGLDLGEKTEDVVKTFTDLAKKLKKENTGAFFMPPRIVDEIMSFFDDPHQPFLNEFFSEVTIKNPDVHAMHIPADIFYQIIEESRARTYRGMTIAEEEIRKSAQMMMGKEFLAKKEFEMTVGPVVKTFRERFRQATRFGFIDSVADLDIIVLAKEIDGYVVSTDEGVTKWGRTFGIKEMSARVFGQKMKALL